MVWNHSEAVWVVIKMYVESKWDGKDRRRGGMILR